MSNLPTERQQQEIAQYGADDNPFLEFAREAKRSRIVGKLLKLTKSGQWIAGENRDPIEEDVALIAYMPEMLKGWIKWEDGRPTEQIMGKIADRFTPPRRSELGDTEPQYWAEQRDPWQFAYYLIMMDPHTGQIYTYAPSSDGGRQALAGLAETYGHAARHRPDELPVVHLGSSSYPHERYGDIWKPVFTVQYWAKRALVDDALQARNEGADQVEAEEPVAAVAPKAPPPRPSNVPLDNSYRAAKDGPMARGPSVSKLPKARF